MWRGAWVADRLGISLAGADPAESAELRSVLGLAVREGNGRRAHLLVSEILGKHVPQRPSVVYGAGRRLGAAVRARLDGAADAGGRRDGTADVRGRLGGAADVRGRLGGAADVRVLGYAETATGLGHCVADELGAVYLHSTRRSVPGVAPIGGFEEEHSHHTSHLLLPWDPELLSGDGPLVLVDDELSTGQTVLNTIAELHRRWPREHYLLAALVDLRGEADRERLARFGAELGARIEAVALAQGRVELPADVLERAAGLGESVPGVASGQGEPGALVRARLDWPVSVPDGGRHGFTPAQLRQLEAALPQLGEQLAAALAGDERRVLVLGSEELMYAPLRLAGALEAALPAVEVRFSSTTRSPVLAVDDPGYPIRTRLRFPAHDVAARDVAARDTTARDTTARDTSADHTTAGPRYAYNVAPGAGAERFDAVLLVLDAVGDTPELHAPDGLLARLREVTDRVVLAVLPSAGALPAPLGGPEFSSYAAAEVGWLLTDLSGVPLEAPTEEREEAVQSGGAHYAESLPVEFQPSPEYQELFQEALRGSARRIALAVGTVAEMLLAERGSGLVLASLARAGTPVGILIRRWLAAGHGIEAPHYAVSIVRGRGIDRVALRYLAARHDPSRVVFVDGWTGKGAIARELAAALDGTPFDPALAVLADPGRCVRTYGTRDDYLIPSACLNSTVSGLVSRTVLRDDLIGPGDFHGAKHYAELAAADVSGQFLDTVAGYFAAVRQQAVAEAQRLAGTDRTPSWEGWAAVERISTEYGIDNVNLVKPGVGETTRVLLRRVPWRILARRGAGPDLDHVRLLAKQRGVAVEEVDELPYSCVGLIHPHYSRGATGASGRTVAE
ncbi:phosphoribosyltransferase [Kitasatospora azatica]|uniref:phosphoribosyltransferase n=1 Tax=Kitasatospora azatica TaxID=58347 RepID=UPI00056179B8|nr:phosphoribosyltransferase [Kitasatospora azatica]